MGSIIILDPILDEILLSFLWKKSCPLKQYCEEVNLMLMIYIAILVLFGFGFIHNLFLALEYLHKDMPKNYRRCKNISVVFFLLMITYSMFMVFVIVGE